MNVAMILDAILDLLLQGVQMLLVLAVAPLVLGVTRKVKARLLRRVGPGVLQPYRDQFNAQFTSAKGTSGTRGSRTTRLVWVWPASHATTLGRRASSATKASASGPMQ